MGVLTPQTSGVAVAQCRACKHWQVCITGNVRKYRFSCRACGRACAVMRRGVFLLRFEWISDAPTAARAVAMLNLLNKAGGSRDA